MRQIKENGMNYPYAVIYQYTPYEKVVKIYSKTAAGLITDALQYSFRKYAIYPLSELLTEGS